MKKYRVTITIEKSFEIEVEDDANEEEVLQAAANEEADHDSDEFDTAIQLIDENGFDMCDCCGEIMAGGFCPNIDCGCHT